MGLEENGEVVVYRYQPASLGYAPPTFQAPELDQPGTFATVSLDRPVGYLVWQLPDRLAWWGLYVADHTAEEETLQRIVFDKVRAAAARGDSVELALRTILPQLLHTAPEHVDRLEVIAARLRPTASGPARRSNRPLRPHGTHAAPPD